MRTGLLASQHSLEGSMRHRRRFFPGKGIFWIFILIFIFGGSGKSGFPGFFIPLMIIWFVVPMLFSMFDRQDWHPSSRPRQRKDQWKRRRPGKGMTREDPFTPRPLQTVQVVEPAVSPTPSRKLDGIPSSCQACGGPANETTIRWRGTKPSCGYCSSGL